MTSIIQRLIEPGIVPVFYHSDPAYCNEVFSISKVSGISAFEFTNRGPKALENYNLLKSYRDVYATEMLLGIGTILNRVDAQDFLNIGVDFIVSPCMVEEVGALCRENNVLYIPGCMTIKEVFYAYEKGFELIKIFPADVVGLGFVQAVKAVLPNMRLMVTGGIRPEKDSIVNWRKSGADIIGIGSALFTKEPEADNREELVRQKLASIVS